MARRYKLIIIIMICAILTYIIFSINKDKKINLVALGDGIASGETTYNLDGISFNDYLKEYYTKYHLLKQYNDSYAFKNNKLTMLIDNINENNVNKNNNLNINQIIHHANIVTIAIGEDELTKLCITKDLNVDIIKEFIVNYDQLIKLIKNISDAKIIIIGLYENNCLDKGSTIILNSELANISSKHNVLYININDMITSNFYYSNQSDYYFNYQGHKAIFNSIVNSI